MRSTTAGTLTSVGRPGFYSQRANSVGSTTAGTYHFLHPLKSNFAPIAFAMSFWA